MDGELLCLKWRDHCSSLFRTLSSVRKKEVYCDATIACDGRFYPVHKFVLSTCSDYFEQMFEMGEQKNIMIVITDIGCEELETLLDYMYFGEVNVLQSDLNIFMKAAERLRIKGLAQKSECGEKRTKGQKEDDRDAKRRRWSEEVPQHSECSQSATEGKSNNSQGKIGETSNEFRNKDHSEPKKGRSLSSEVHIASSLENTRLEADILDINARELASEHNAEVKLEPFNVKVEPEDWRHAEIVEDTSVFTSSEPTETYLRPSTPALPLSTSGIGAGDHGNNRNTQPDNLVGSAQPLPGPSGLHSTWDHGSASIPLQSEEFSHYRTMSNKGMGMGPRKTGRPTSDIWNHYRTEKSNGKNYVICIYCTTQKYGYPNATKMKIHTVKCIKCPENIRKQYKQELAQMVAKSEASKSVLLKQTPGFEAQGYS